MKFLTALSFCACAGPLAAASLFLETFSTDNDTSGWFHISTGTTDFLNQDPGDDHLRTGAIDFTVLYVIADSSSSGGAFVGDLSAAGIGAFQFDLNLVPGSSITNLFFELANFSDGETWAYNLSLPLFDTDTTFIVPLDGAGWTQSSGSQSFSYILGNTEEIAIAFESEGTGSMAASIDNVQSIPEPTSIALLGFAALFATARRRRN